MIRISEPKREIATLAGDRVGALGPPLWSRMWGSGGAVGGILNQWGSGGGPTCFYSSHNGSWVILTKAVRSFVGKNSGFWKPVLKVFSHICYGCTFD